MGTGKINGGELRLVGKIMLVDKLLYFWDKF